MKSVNHKHVVLATDMSGNYADEFYQRTKLTIFDLGFSNFVENLQSKNAKYKSALRCLLQEL
jgi:hypothetical protein